MSNGDLSSQVDVNANAVVDELAKEAAKKYRLPAALMEAVLAPEILQSAPKNENLNVIETKT